MEQHTKKGELKVTTGPQKTVGGQDQALTSDDRTQQLLEQMLRQLKFQSMQLSIISDSSASPEDSD